MSRVGSPITRRRGFLCALACAALTLTLSAEAQAKAPADFWPSSPVRHTLRSAAPAETPSFAANIRGSLTSAGNTLETCPQNLAAAKSKGARAGEACLNSDNNNLDMRYVNVDPGGGRFNSSTAAVSIPSDARVVRAFLYWGADLARGVQNGADAGAPGGETPVTNTLWKQIRLRMGSGPYVNIDATDPLRDGRWDGVPSWYSQPGNRPGFAYQVRADVTVEARAAFQATNRRSSAGARLVAATVANVQAGQGYNRHAGWTMEVVWESPSAAWRNLTIFDGFAFVQVQGGQQLVVGPLDFTGFETPASGAVDAHATTWTYEGDRGITGDYFALGKLGEGCAKLPHASNAANPVNNFFNSTISRDGMNVVDRKPAYVNQLGFDLDALDVPEGTIPNNATGASVCLGTVGDTYFFGGVAFDVLIRAPNVKIDKVADRSQANPGDVVTYTTSVTNPERQSGDPLYPTPTVAATNLVITDPLPAGLDFVDFTSNPGGVCTYVAPSRAISCTVGTLAPSASFAFSYRASVSAAAQGSSAALLTNVACYGSNSEDQPDVDYTGCDEASVLVPPAPYVDLGVVKTVSNDVIAPGGTLTWHLVATNWGPGVSTGFVLADQLPPGVAFQSATPSAGLTCTTPPVGASGAITCTAPSVPPAPAAGSVLTLDIAVSVPAGTADGTVLTNVATVNGDQLEPVPDPHVNRDTVETRVVTPLEPLPPAPPPAPDPDGPVEPPVPPVVPPSPPPGPAGTTLTLLKQADPKRVARGGTVTYRLTVSNNGEAAALGVRICDTLPGGLEPTSTKTFKASGGALCATVGTARAGADAHAAARGPRRQYAGARRHEPRHGSGVECPGRLGRGGHPPGCRSTAARGHRLTSRHDHEHRARVLRAAGDPRCLVRVEQRGQGPDGPAPLRARDARRRAPAPLELLLPRSRQRPAGALRRSGARDRARPPRRESERAGRRDHGLRRAHRGRRDVDRGSRPATTARSRSLRRRRDGCRARRLGALLLLQGAGRPRGTPRRELSRARARVARGARRRPADRRRVAALSS